VGHIAGIGRAQFGMGKRHFAGTGIYNDDLGCPYYPSYTAPTYCTYNY
jgi:hypothetical protein